jgi:hypothetical protein
MDATILFKDGKKREFVHKSRPGGSYNISVEYKGGFVIVTDEWSNKVAFPAQDISEVRTTGTDRC